MKGSLEQAGPRWRLRFTRDLDHPVPRVWAAVTEPGDLETWFPFRITGDWAVGSHLTFSDPRSRVPDFTGEVLAFQPPELLEFRWGPDTLRLEVVARETGCTLTLCTRSANTARRPATRPAGMCAWTHWPVIWTGAARRRPACGERSIRAT